MNDLVERLRCGTGDGLRAYDWMNEAADYIEALEDRISSLEAALGNAVDETKTLEDCIADLEFALEKAADALHDAGCHEAWAKARAALAGGKDE